MMKAIDIKVRTDVVPRERGEGEIVIPIEGGAIVLHSIEEHGSGKFYFDDWAD